jgi:DNA-binding NarL/FixJ family response regulator
MMDRPQVAGSVLLVSEDTAATVQLSEPMQQLALSVEPCTEIATAADRLSKQKFEAVVIDLSIGHPSLLLHEKIRASLSNRGIVTFAITDGDQSSTRALRAGFNFVLERPLTPESIHDTLKVAFGSIVRERRRYFRYPIRLPVAFNRKNEPVVYGRTINLSERGMAVSISSPLPVHAEGTVQFTLADPVLRITAECRVCWSNESGDAGLIFLFLPFDTASELQAWLAQKLEAQLPRQVTERFRHQV